MAVRAGTTPAAQGPPPTRRSPGRHPRASTTNTQQTATDDTERTPIEAVERACDATFLTLVQAGCVGTHPEDLVVATLRTIMREAHALHEDASLARRWWAA